MQTGLHHVHRRKNKIKGYEKYPSGDKWKRLMDRFIYVVAVFGPVISLPQIWKIWILKEAVGVSAITWSGYLLIAIFWLIYGFMHKEKPIIFANVLWLFIHSTIVIGVVIYG